jgi:hypothetical protein
MIPKPEICLVTQCVSGRKDKRYISRISFYPQKMTLLTGVYYQSVEFG